MFSIIINTDVLFSNISLQCLNYCLILYCFQAYFLIPCPKRKILIALVQAERYYTFAGFALHWTNLKLFQPLYSLWVKVVYFIKLNMKFWLSHFYFRSFDIKMLWNSYMTSFSKHVVFLLIFRAHGDLILNKLSFNVHHWMSWKYDPK